MKKRLFYFVAIWYEPDRWVNGDRHISHQTHSGHGAFESEDAARGRFMRYLDEKRPEYKLGSRFEMNVHEIEPGVILACVG